MQRYEIRKEEFKKALSRLEEGISIQKPDELQLDGILQRFEFTFELAWKTLKDYLEYHGFAEKIGSPREIIQQGYKQGIIKDGNKWIEMMLARNSLSYLYDKEASREIYDSIKWKYVSLLEELVEALKEA